MCVDLGGVQEERNQMKHKHGWKDKKVLLQKIRIKEKTLNHVRILVVRQGCSGCGEERTMRREEMG